MRFTTWCVGWLVIVMWADLSMGLQLPHLWPVILAVGLWFLLGASISLAYLIRSYLGKLGAGVRAPVRPGLGAPPAPQQKPKEG